MNKKAAILVLIAIGIALALYSFNRNPGQNAASRQPTVEQQNAAVATALAHQTSNTVAMIDSNFAQVQIPPMAHVIAGTAAGIAAPPAGLATPPEFTNLPPQSVVENMSRAIRQYGTMFGGNPVGTNPEFTKQLGGDNPRHINFISSEAGMRVNANGELVDPWGTPYFFHQISGSNTEVHSAGQDKIMWTSDDVVAH
jgi:hypothetical protein